MEKSHGSSINSIEIPEEIIIEILHRLPLKSLHKFKRVSKSWHFLIAEEILPKALKPQLIGFFGQTICHVDLNDIPNGATAVRPPFSFLPPSVSNLAILDCCSGLFLCCTTLDIPSSKAYYVCNPITKSWTQLPWIGYHEFHNRNMILDFEPYASAHYKVYSIQTFGDQMLILIYHSGTRRLGYKWVNGGAGFLRGIVRLHCSVWNGAVYLYVRSGDQIEVKYKTIRLAISKEDVVYPEFIDFPVGTKFLSDGARIGMLGRRLCFASLDGPRLRVWTLGGKHEKEWVMVKESTICGIPRFNLVGFHPLQTLVIFLLDCVLFAYDLKEMSLFETGRIELEVIEMDSTSVFPFFPLLLDVLENQNYQ